jgi:hypothetical protein
MSLRTLSQSTFEARTFNARTFGGAGVVVITDPVSGWVSSPVNRHFVSSSAHRVSITTPQDRVWIARANNG